MECGAVRASSLAVRRPPVESAAVGERARVPDDSECCRQPVLVGLDLVSSNSNAFWPVIKRARKPSEVVCRPTRRSSVNNTRKSIHASIHGLGRVRRVFHAHHAPTP